MNRTAKKVFSIILMVIFIFFNLIHLYWPIHLILEDIKAGTMEGTFIELGVLYPWMIELVSLFFVLLEGVYFIIFRKVKYFNVANFVVFCIYIFQVILFNSLLLLSW